MTASELRVHVVDQFKAIHMQTHYLHHTGVYVL